MDFSKFEAFIFDKMSKSKLPGLSVVIIDGGEILWSRGFGFRDLERGLSATPHTLYAIASVTKSFTAIALLQLQEQGKLSLEDPIDKYIPLDMLAKEEPILLRHLLSHASGIPALAYAESVIRGVMGAGEHWIPIANYDDMFTFLQNAQSYARTKPGERWFYLNEGYVLLGYVIEKVSGTPYSEYVRENILHPLDMKRSFFTREAVAEDQDAATPYIITRDKERVPTTYPYGMITADGGLISNVLDLARYVSMFLGRGELGGKRILNSKSLESMETPRVSRPYTEGPFRESAYGYGLGVLPDFLGHKIFGHSGGLYAATAYIGYIVEQNIGIALLANGDGYPLSQFGMYGLALLLGEDPTIYPIFRLERMLDELEGTYETYKGTMKALVKRSGDFLILEVKDKYSDLVVYLIPETLDEECRIFYTLASGNKLPVEVTIKDDHVELIYERYLLKKTGKLPS
ncbi:MAG: serine hydrolase [Anaerolineales bacterium]|nr:serine hydrolase [Anaerolineales bacterium]